MKSAIIIQAQLELDINLKNEDLFYKIKDKSILEYTIDQALKCSVDKVVVFYSQGNEKNIDIEYIKSKGVILYKNNGQDGFLKQFYKIAIKENIDCIVRVIGNNPLIIPELIDKSVNEHIRNNYDYTYFKGYPIGIRPSEIISKSCLDKINFVNCPKDYARYITTTLLNNDALKSNCFKLLGEYAEYDKVDFSFLKNKANKIASILQEGVNFINIKKYFKPIPNTIRNIEITNVCNLNCIMCSRSGELSKKNKVKKGFMKVEDFKTIIEKFEFIDELTLLGGEPLLHPNIKEIIEYCVNKDIKVDLVTNGILLNKDLSEFLIKNLHAIRFSIDGPNKKIYELIREKANYEVLINNINEFMDIYEQSESVNIKKIGINYVYMKQNLNYMDKMLELSKKLRIKEISFNPYCNPSFITDPKIIDEFNIKNMDDINYMFDKVKTMANKLNINVKIDPYDSSWIHRWDQCEYIESFYITWDGYITPCCAIDKKELINFGSIINNTIDELYNSDKWYFFRKGLICNKPHEVCKKNCYYYYGNLT